MHYNAVVAFLSLAARTHASLTSINTAASGFFAWQTEGTGQQGMLVPVHLFVKVQYLV